MTNIKVDKTELLDKMRENRDKHHDVFLKAQQRYREEVIKALDLRLSEARGGKRIILVFNFPEPVDYTESYDDAIARFNWHQGDTVELDESEFAQFVLDKWGWQRAFAASTMSYLS